MPLVNQLSPWKAFVARWENCDACPLHQCRTKIVLARGQIPCDVLFVGEAPGQSEDSLGKPFVGPAGILLDEIIAQAVPESLRKGFTNLICCIPLGEDGSKTEAPPPDSIRACSTRLLDFIALAKPRLIVNVGSFARDWVPSLLPGQCRIPMLDIVHPAAILKGNAAVKPLKVRECVTRIRQAVKEHHATS